MSFALVYGQALWALDHGIQNTCTVACPVAMVQRFTVRMSWVINVKDNATPVSARPMSDRSAPTISAVALIPENRPCVGILSALKRTADQHVPRFLVLTLGPKLLIMVINGHGRCFIKHHRLFTTKTLVMTRADRPHGCLFVESSLRTPSQLLAHHTYHLNRLSWLRVPRLSRILTTLLHHSGHNKSRTAPL